MKKLLFFLGVAFILNGNAGASGVPFDKASIMTQHQFRLYLESQGYINRDEHPVVALDEDLLEVFEVVYKKKKYDYIRVYSGDTEHGPLFKANTLNLLGGNSDGDFYLFSPKWIDLE